MILVLNISSDDVCVVYKCRRPLSVAAAAVAEAADGLKTNTASDLNNTNINKTHQYRHS